MDRNQAKRGGDGVKRGQLAGIRGRSFDQGGSFGRSRSFGWVFGWVFDFSGGVMLH